MTKTVLHVGCGNEKLPPYLQHCKEVRLDIEPGYEPDIVADMVHLPEGIGPFDAVFSCHSLEHLYPYDVIPCLQGFRRVLKPDGVVMILVPDLEDVLPNDGVVYESPMGPVTGLDMYYGMASCLKEHPYMAHHCGFVQGVLARTLKAAGFKDVRVTRHANDGVLYRSLFGIAKA